MLLGETLVETLARCDVKNACNGCSYVLGGDYLVNCALFGCCKKTEEAAEEAAEDTAEEA